MLKTPKVRILVETESVRLEPVSELAGCLKSYTKQLPMDDARESAWTAAMYEKHFCD